MPILRSVSGLRATINDGLLTTELVARHVRAFAAMQPAGTVAVGYDGRPGGATIAAWVCEELCSVGRNVLALGCVPTPTVQLIVERYHLAGGIIVTASHNGPEWNGLKFLERDGTVLAPCRAMELWARSDRNDQPSVAIRGTLSVHTDPIGEHIAAVERVPLARDLRQSQACAGMSIVVDAVNASGSAALPRLIEWLGATPIPLYCDGTGTFPHPPEPLPEHLQDIAIATAQQRACLGVAVDPDADRLVLIHSLGQTISEEKPLCWPLSQCCSSKPVERLLSMHQPLQRWNWWRRFGATVLRSAVGEANVVALMRASSAVIGGEGSGGVILPACHYGRDSLVGVTLILALRAALSQQEWDARTLHSPLVMRKRKRPWHGDFVKLSQRLIQQLGDGAQRWEGDGIRLRWQDRWLHVRPPTQNLSCA